MPDGREERRRGSGGRGRSRGRLRVRSPTDPPGEDGLPEIVIEPVDGAFGTGAHPTTRMSLELLLGLEPGGGFADLGCGAGVLAIAAARLGWEPVFAVDVEERAVESARRNAERNGVAVQRGPGRPARGAAAAGAHARGEPPVLRARARRARRSTRPPIT